MYTAIGNLDRMEKLAISAEADEKNIAFSAYLLTSNVEACANILVATNHLPEAASFERTYLPFCVDEIIFIWKANLANISQSTAQTLASLTDKSFLFLDFDTAVQVGNMLSTKWEETKIYGLSSTECATAKRILELNLIKLVKPQSAPSEPNIPIAPEGGDSDSDEQAEADTHSTLNNNDYH